MTMEKYRTFIWGKKNQITFLFSIITKGRYMPSFKNSTIKLTFEKNTSRKHLVSIIKELSDTV